MPLLNPYWPSVGWFLLRMKFGTHDLAAHQATTLKTIAPWPLPQGSCPKPTAPSPLPQGSCPNPIAPRPMPQGRYPKTLFIIIIGMGINSYINSQDMGFL